MPQPHRLDWTNAWPAAPLGRLSPDAAATHDLHRGEMANRLKAELAAGHLPFIDMPYRAALESGLAGLQPTLARYRHMVLLGIGGSALGARALQRAFFPQQDRPGHDGPWLWIADNVDAGTMEAWFASLPPEQTLVVAVSKSGGTIETLAQYFLAKQWLQSALGDRWREHMLVVTDETSGFLRQEAQAANLPSLPVPDHLGGRYSVLSAVGLVPAAFMGLDWRALLDGAQAAGASLVADPASALPGHPAWQLALWNMALADAHYSQLIFFCYVPLWAPFGPWFAQLWAESLGKESKGTMPLPAVGVTDQHSLQQMFLDGPRDKGCLFLTCPGLPQGRPFPADLPDKWAFLKGRRFGELLDAEGLGTRMALAKQGTPLVELRMGSTGEAAAGRLMGLLELATLFTGWLMNINPLDQPAVELGKRLANARLGAPGYPAEEADLAAFLGRAEQSQEF